MTYRVKISVKETAKMKKAGVVSQRVQLTLEMAFKKEDSPKKAAEAMGQLAAKVIEHTSLLGEYMTGDDPKEEPK